MDCSLLSGLPSINAQLQRWLTAQGLRLLSISCNGRVIAEAPMRADPDTREFTVPEQPDTLARNAITHKER
jgi:hypothetical protein